LRIRYYSFFLLVPVELSSNQVLWIERRNRPEHLDLLVANRLAMKPAGEPSMPKKATTCSIWFSITSRIAPVSS